MQQLGSSSYHCIPMYNLTEMSSSQPSMTTWLWGARSSLLPVQLGAQPRDSSTRRTSQVCSMSRQSTWLIIHRRGIKPPWRHKLSTLRFIHIRCGAVREAYGTARHRIRHRTAPQRVTSAVKENLSRVTLACCYERPFQQQREMTRCYNLHSRRVLIIQPYSQVAPI